MISKLLQWARPSGPNHTETCRCEPGTRTSGIYIQGCARSGNTLMRNLCVAAFAKAELAKLHDDAAEISFGRFVQFLGHGKVWVASRNQRSSLEMTAQELHSYPNVKVLWMLRDPRDVLTSVHRMDASKFWVSPERWIKSIELYHQLKNEAQVATVRYERLVEAPNEVQHELSPILGLQPTCQFSEAYHHFPTFAQNVRAMHSIRKVDTGSVQKWRSNPDLAAYLTKLIKECPKLVEVAESVGYSMEPA
jgi:hypothetical protein